MSQIKHEKQWILTTNQDYTPNGVLQLGQILTNYTDPKSAILTEGTAPIPKNTLKEESDEQEVNYKSSEPMQTAFRAWLKVLSNITTSPEINNELQKGYQITFGGHAISVITFQPSKNYVETALSLNDTSGLTPVPWYVTHRRIWLVTGLRIVGKRTKINEGFINQATGRAELIKSPIQELLSMLNNSYQDSGTLIYSYCLHEIIIKRKLKTTVRAFSRGHLQWMNEMTIAVMTKILIPMENRL
jgi:hypothetical protein